MYIFELNSFKILNIYQLKKKAYTINFKLKNIVTCRYADHGKMRVGGLKN